MSLLKDLHQQKTSDDEHEGSIYKRMKEKESGGMRGRGGRGEVEKGGRKEIDGDRKREGEASICYACED